MIPLTLHLDHSLWRGAESEALARGTTVDAVLVGALADTLSRLEEDPDLDDDPWTAAIAAGDAASAHGAHRDAARHYAEAVEAAVTALAELPALERLARARLLGASPREAATAARRAMVIAGHLGDGVRAGALARLCSISEAVATADRAVQYTVAGLVALDDGDGVTAARQLYRGATAAAEAGRAQSEMRARGALAAVRLASGHHRQAAREADRARTLAEEVEAHALAEFWRVLGAAARLGRVPLGVAPGDFRAANDAAEAAEGGDGRDGSGGGGTNGPSDGTSGGGRGSGGCHAEGIDDIDGMHGIDGTGGIGDTNGAGDVRATDAADADPATPADAPNPHAEEP